MASFRCEHCGACPRPARSHALRDHAGNTNNEIQSAGEIGSQGSVYTVKVTDRQDLDRELVKSEYGTVTIPEYELTIPPGKGQMTTIEGLVSDVITDLSADQPVRMHIDAATHDKIEALLDKLRIIIDETQPLPTFTVSLDDPSGNSFAQPSSAGLADPKWRKRQYNRTKEQNIKLGLLPPEAADPPPPRVATLTDDMDSEMPAEVFSFPSTCSSCGATLETLMKHVVIPHFKDVWLMSSSCHSCGYRDTEIKSGGEIAQQGRKITLLVEDEEDLKRDILKVMPSVSRFLLPPLIREYRATPAASRSPRSSSSCSPAPSAAASPPSRACSTRSTRSSTSASLRGATRRSRGARTRWRPSSAG